MNIFSTHRVVPLAVVLLSAGCQVDNDLPSNPILDATLAITSLDTLHLAGTAEYNAAIAITGGVEAGAVGEEREDVPVEGQVPERAVADVVR